MKKSGWSNKTKALRKVGKVMHEFKEGTLHSGKSDKVVKNPKQAIAIALSEAGLSKKETGGGVDEQGIDLFEDYENIPENVQNILDKYEDDFVDGNYSGLEKASNELEKIGYTFEYYLDGQAYDLRPIGTKGKSEVEEYANGGGVGNDWFNKGVGTNGLNKIKEYSKQNPKLLFLVTDDNYSNIGSYYLLDGKFAKKTVANASYDLQKSKVNLKPKSDVIYKMKQLGDPNGYYENGGAIDINDLDMPVIRTQFEDEEYEYAKGGSIGDSGKITDKNSMFVGKMGTITGDLGNMYEVMVLDNGNKRTVLVKKNGISIVSDDYAKGGSLYSSDEMYVLEVIDMNTGRLVDEKKFRAKNQLQAEQIAFDEYEDSMKQKHGDYLNFMVYLAASLKANGGGVGENNNNFKEIDGNKYFSYDFENKGNKWGVLISWGKYNHVNVTKKTNNPFGYGIGKEFNDIGEAVDNYKDVNIKSNILFAANMAKEYGYEPKYADGGAIDINDFDMPVIRSQFEEEEFEFGNGGAIYSRTMRTPDGTIVGKVQYNDFWKTYQVVIDGTVYEEFKTQEEAIQNLKNAGFDKMALGGGVESENKDMVLNNNKQIAHHTKEMSAAVRNSKYVPAWVVAKVNRSATDLSDATHYMEGEGESYANGGETKTMFDSTKQKMQGKTQQERIDSLIEFVSQTKWSSKPITVKDNMVIVFSKMYDLEPVRVASIFNKYQKQSYANGGNTGGTSDSAEMDAPTLGGTMSSSMFEGDTYSNRFENKLWNEIADGTPHSFKNGGAISQGKKYGDWILTQYTPLSYDDLGGLHGGMIKLVNQNTFDEIIIWNDKALRSPKWSISYNKSHIEDKNPSIVIEKVLKSYANNPKLANGGNTGGTSDSAEMNAPTLGGTMTSSMAKGGAVGPQIAEIKAKIEKAKKNTIMPANLKKQYIEKYQKQLAALEPKKEVAKKAAPKKAAAKKVVAKKATKAVEPTRGRTERGLVQDKERLAKKAGKRISESGGVYYENRENRSDKNRKTRLEDGGNIKGWKHRNK